MRLGRKATGQRWALIAGPPKKEEGATASSSAKKIGEEATLLVVCAEGSGPGAGHRPEILVIDDDSSMREFLIDTLAELGYDAEAVTNGVEGLRRLEARRYDLVITDYMMPEMTGVEIAETIRRQYPSQKLMMITGLVGDPNVDHLRQRGLTVLGKPVRVEQLTAAVEQLLRRA